MSYAQLLQLAAEMGKGILDTGQGIQTSENASKAGRASQARDAALWEERRRRGRDSTAVDYAEEDDSNLLGPSEMGGAYADAGDVAAQQQALDRLGLLSEGNLLPEDMDRLQGLDARGDQVTRAQQGALQNMLSAQGAGGGVASERMMAQSGGQADANRSSGMMQQATMDAQRRGIQATQERAGLASRMRNQSFDEARRRAEANDAVSRSNADYARGLGDRNANRRNATDESRAADEREGIRDREGWIDGSIDQERANYAQSQADQRQSDAMKANTINTGARVGTGFATFAIDDDEDDDA